MDRYESTTGIAPLSLRRANSRRVLWLCVWTGALLLLFALTQTPLLYADAPHGDDVELKGTVLNRPPAPNGVGLWSVRGRVDDQNQTRVYTVSVGLETDFGHGLPRIGDRVKVKGQRLGELVIAAEKLDREDGDGSPGGYETHGRVAARPGNPDGIGVWQLTVDRSGSLTVTTTAQTRFFHGVPAVGQWVEVKGRLQSDGSLLAERMRVDEFEADEVIVRLRPGVVPAQLTSRRPLTLAQSILAATNIHLFASATDGEVEQELVQQILSQDRDLVEWAELNFAGGIPEGNPYDIWEWGGQEESGYVNQIAFAQVWRTSERITMTGAGLVVAVIDSGVSQSHPALAPLLLAGRDWVDDDLIADEEPGGSGWGHGTHVAGIIAHMAPDARILPIRVLDPHGRGNSFDVAAALEWAVLQGADVINLSLGSETDSRLLRDAVQWTNDQGVLVVAAAGNNESSAPHFPAAYGPAIAVTGVDASNVKASFANFSSEWVDVAAPAVGITSTIVGPDGDGYAGWSGTSMATAFVSGALALARQQNPTASPAQLTQTLRESAIDLDGINPSYAGALGGGLLNAHALLDLPTFLLFAPQLQSTASP